MGSDYLSDAELEPPEIALELVDDITPPAPPGFLELRRRRLVARYPDGSVSSEFTYDEVGRLSLIHIPSPRD